MPEVVAKIFHDDGTESSFGPVEISKSMAAELIKGLEPAEQKRLESLERQRADQASQEQEVRSKEAEKANQARIKAASKGDVD